MALERVLSEIVKRQTALERRIAEPLEPTNSCCLLSASKAQTIPHNTITSITFDTEIRDLDDLHTVAAPTRITIKVAGVYIITGHVLAANAAVDGLFRIYRNGAAIGGITLPLAGGKRMPVAKQALCAVGDYLELTFYQFSGGDLDISLASFEATRIG